jgi:predicted small secreted protein
MTKTFKSALIITAFAVAALTNVACSTVSGAGKDIKGAGETITKTADENKPAQ